MESFFIKVKGIIEAADDSANYFLDSWNEHNFTVSKSSIFNIIKALKENGFQYLVDITGAHYPDTKNEFQIVYHIHNLTENLRIRLKVNLDSKNLEVPSMVSLYDGANWMERETFDFYGISFTNHPNLTRILNVDDMDYHPMRKEYKLEDETRTDKSDKYFGR